ncbi:MAG: ABC transporter permease [Blastocatellia bacterium]|nr:ABC transporter permease [Blastocatellia bacterium]
MDSFSFSVATRGLVHNLRQSFLTIGVVAISVTLIIFLTSLISGLQNRLINSVTGAIAHVVVRQKERVPTTLNDSPTAKTTDTLYIGETVKLEQRKRKIEDWTIWVKRLESFDPNIIAVSPVVEGQGIVSRGEKRRTVAISGVIPEKQNIVVDIQSKLVNGRFFGINAGEVVLGYKLAEDFSLQLGDKVRIVSTDGNSATYTVAGIFDTGFNAVDTNTVYISLRDAQSLFGLGTAVTTIGLKLREIFQADVVAERLSKQIPYETNSWMKDNQNILSGLRAQAQSSNLILVFTTVASGFGIASILIMSVVSKLKEIGILKAIGATQKQILSVFAIEGTLLAMLGGLVGSGLGTGLCLFLMTFRTVASTTGRQADVFPMNLTFSTVAMALTVAVVTGFVSSLYPAWRAARTNPIEVIRGA